MTKLRIAYERLVGRTSAIIEHVNLLMEKQEASVDKDITQRLIIVDLTRLLSRCRSIIKGSRQSNRVSEADIRVLLRDINVAVGVEEENE